MGFKGLVLFISLAITLSATAAQAGYDAYIAVKGGEFLPNGKGSVAAGGGFGNFSQGFSAEVAAGIRPESYAAVELGGGYYQTNASVADTVTGVSHKYNAYAIPVTLTAKGILPYGRLELFAGAGLGYWSARLQDKRVTTTTGAQDERNVNAGALGYQVVAGADYRVGRRLDLGAEAKWVAVQPEFDLGQTPGSKVKWEFGGTTVNLVLKYRF